MSCRLGLLRAKETALFVCDMQEKFRSKIQFFDQVASISGRLVSAARILRIPILVTEQYPKGLGHSVPELGLANHSDIHPLSKTQFSMLGAGDQVSQLLQQQSIKSVLLCGIEAHVCVQYTCLDLMQRGIEVHVVADAVSSRTQTDRMFALERMRSAGALITTSESVILGLVGDSSHPQFKDIQQLILTSAPDTGLLSSSHKT